MDQESRAQMLYGAHSALKADGFTVHIFKCLRTEMIAIGRFETLGAILTISH
jgi:hypothetical protein